MGKLMSSNDAGRDVASTEQHDEDHEMTDPQEYGSLSIEDPAGDESDPSPSSTSPDPDATSA